MKSRTKIWLITASCLVIVGAVVLTVVMSECNWDFVNLSTVKYELLTYETDEEFSDISINTSGSDIIFLPSDDEKCRVECYEEEKLKHSVAVEKDTLIIKQVDDRAWYDHIGINFGFPKITVYLPEAEYTSLSVDSDTGEVKLSKDLKFESVDISLFTGDVDFLSSASGLVKITTSTGDISVQNTLAGQISISTSTGRVSVYGVVCEENINIKVSTGETELTDIECKTLSSSGSTGDISLNNVIVKDKLSVKRSTGDVLFSLSDADEIFVETDTGDIEGSFITDKVFIAHSDTGRINVPDTVSGGKCKISTDTGDILLKIKKN